MIVELTRATARVACAFALVGIAHAQQLQFEVASVKPSGQSHVAAPGRSGGGGGCPESYRIDPDRVTIQCATVGSLIARAFRNPLYRITGPDWILERQGSLFDIEATYSAPATEAQVPEMLQSLLAQRFHLAIHRSRKEQDVYALVVSREGLKVKQALPFTDDESNAAATITQVGGVATRTTRAAHADGTGFTITWSNPLIGTVRKTEGPDFTFRLDAPSTTFAGLVPLLDPNFTSEVVDMTGLDGRYQVHLEVSLKEAFAAAAGSDLRADMQSAMLKDMNDGLMKLGLRFERRKAMLDYVVVDHVERPSGN
jgi:uncharacterized protein (TIGR03435 family)